MLDDDYYMGLALAEARAAADEGEIPVGAIVVASGRVIGRGHNQTERLSDVTAHAEILAITSAANSLGGKYLPGATLYVTVEPCPMCAGAIGWSQLGRIVIGAPTQSAATPPCSVPERHHSILGQKSEQASDKPNAPN